MVYTYTYIFSMTLQMGKLKIQGQMGGPSHKVAKSTFYICYFGAHYFNDNALLPLTGLLNH